MDQPLECLSKMTYPGRMIVLGRDMSGEFNIAVYAVTGRSPSSRARKLILESNTVWTKPTDPELLKKGNPELLVYPAVVINRGIAVSNGKQTADIDVLAYESPVHALESAMKSWTYEPDPPIFTPRISGCILPSNKAALSVIRKAANEDPLRNFFEFSLVADKGKMIATYAGENKDPLPSFCGEPLDIEMREPSARATAEAVYEALRPQRGNADFRVAVACVFAKASNMTDYQLFIINHDERTKT